MGVPADAGERCAGDDRVAVDRDRAAEKLAAGRVRGGQLGGLGTCRAPCPRERIRRALVDSRANISVWSARNDRVACGRDRETELVIVAAVCRGQLRGLGAPRCARARERVDGALVEVRADVAVGSAGNDRVGVDRDGGTERVAPGAV